MSDLEQFVVIELRRSLLLPLDDLLPIVRTFINPNVSRSGLDPCLRPHSVVNLKALYPVEEGEVKPIKSYKDFEPIFVHVDVKYLPKMADESSRRYLFVAIDRARGVSCHHAEQKRQQCGRVSEETEKSCTL